MTDIEILRQVREAISNQIAELEALKLGGTSKIVADETMILLDLVHTRIENLIRMSDTGPERTFNKAQLKEFEVNKLARDGKNKGN